MNTVLIDSCIFIEYLRTGKGDFISLIDQLEKGTISLATSTIVIYEIWSGLSLDKKGTQERITQLLQPIEILDLTPEIARVAGQLNRSQLANGMDALIAATAVVHHLQLATLNARHFQNIPHLKLFNFS